MLRALARVVDALLLFVIAGLVFAWSPAFAGCRANDQWRGSDKQLHALAGGGIAFVVTLHTADPLQGFLWGAGAGLVKEATDAAGMGDCTLQDLAVTVAAAGIAAYTGGFIVTRVQGRTLVAYSRSF